MAYQTQTFTDNETVLTAAMMDHIEAGIVANETSIEDVSTDLTSHYVQKNVIASSFDDTMPYTEGQYVWYENVLCRFLVDHEPGTFVDEEVEYLSEDGLSGEVASAVRYDEAQIMTVAQKAQARGNIGAQSRVEPDDSVQLELNDSESAYITGDVGQQIQYSTSAASLVFKHVAFVQGGCDYVLFLSSGQLASSNARVQAIVDDSDVIIQRFNATVAENGTTETRFTAEVDGILCVCVDTSTDDIQLHGGPLYGTVRYNTPQTLTDTQKVQARKNIGALGNAELDGHSGSNLLAPLCNVHGSITTSGRTIEIDGCRFKKERISSAGSSNTICVSLLGNTFHYWNAGTGVSDATVIGQGLQDSDFVPAPIWMLNMNAYILHIVTSWRSTTDTATNGRVMFFTKDANGVITPSNVFIVSNRDPDYKVSLSFFVTQEFGYAVMNNGNLAFVYSNSNSQATTDQEFFFSIENALADMSYLAPMESATAGENHEFGELISYGNRLYRVINSIAAGETLSGSNTESTSVARELSFMDNAIAAETTGRMTSIASEAEDRERADTVLRGVLGLMDYRGDDADFAEVPGATNASCIGAVVRGETLTLNGTNNTTAYVYLRMSGNCAKVSSSTTVKGWEGTFASPTGHLIRCTLTLISGTVDGTVTVSFYKSGTSSTVGTMVRRDNTIYQREWTSDGDPLSVVVLIAKDTVLTNAKFRLVMQDITNLFGTLPTPPDTDGTYTMNVTVTNGVPAYSWAAN